MLSYHRSDSGDASSDISKFTQASSNFSWRPNHKPYDMSGNVTVSKNESSADSAENQRLSTSVGTRYRFSRRLNLLANLSFAVAESGDQQTETTGQNVNLAYNSEQTIIAGFNYGWAASTGLSNSTTEVSGGSGDGGISGDADSDRDTQSASIGLGHHLSNSWAVGRASSVNMGFSQNVTFSRTNSSEDDAEEGATTLSNGLSSGWSHRGLDSTSFVSLSINDSHRFGDEETDSQLLNFQLTRNQTLSRVSGLSVNAAFQSSRQARENQESTTSKSANAGIGYNNSRAFGVYNLRLQARLQYQPAIDDNANNRDITRFFSTLYYRIGKLSTNVSLIVTQTELQDLAYGLNFNATRTF